MNITENLTPVNHDSGRAGHSIVGIILHTMVGTTASARARFFNGNAQVSANYLVSLDGSISRCVRESDTAWCNGNYQSNLTTISIEHEDNGDYNGPRTPQLYEASSELVADICRRYSIPCDRAHIKGHNEVIDKSVYPGGTACPDGLDLNRIIAGANTLLNPTTPLVSQPVPSATGETVFLPSDNISWRLYPTNVLPVVGNEKAKLVPSAFPPGLTYAVLGHPYPNVVTIQTQQFGTGNIWVGTDTDARITAAPTPAPIAPAIVAAVPDKAPTTTKSTYTRLESPLTLKANKQPTNVYNLDAGSWSVLNKAVVKTLNQNDVFVAVGRAKHPLGGVYYMADEDFGQAEQSGTPNHNQGINTVDLTLEVPTPPSIPPVTPPPLVISDNSGATPVVTSTDAQVVPVNIIPTDPDAWKKIDTSVAGEYTANTSIHIYDLERQGEPEQLLRGQDVNVGGKLKKDGIEYYITKKKIAEGKYYGIPTIALSESTLDSDGNIFDLAIAEDMKQELKNAMKPVGLREKAIRQAAIADVKKLHLSNPFRRKK